jgi:hypothetical protein
MKIFLMGLVGGFLVNAGPMVVAREGGRSGALYTVAIILGVALAMFLGRGK